MAIYTGIGFSKGKNTSYAAREAALEAKAQAAAQDITLALVFATSHYDSHETLRVVQQILVDAVIFGCSTTAMVFAQTHTHQGIMVIALSSRGLAVSLGCAEDIRNQNLQIAGAELARNAITEFKESHRAAFLLFCDGQLQNKDLLVAGAQGVFGKIFPIVGAGTSISSPHQKNFQFFQNQPLSLSAVGALLGGEIRIHTAVRHGWKPLGKPRFVDQSDGETIKQIDGKKASALFEEYLDVDLETLKKTFLRDIVSFYPLGIYAAEESQYFLRNVLEILDDGSILCQGSVPKGCEIHIMISNKDFALEAALEATQEIKQSFGSKQPALVLALEAASRYHILKRSLSDQMDALRKIMGPQTAFCSVSVSGEIAPSKAVGKMAGSCLYNGSILLIGIG